jgi:hypothetical protein
MNARVAMILGALLLLHAVGAETFRCGQWIASTAA